MKTNFKYKFIFFCLLQSIFFFPSFILKSQPSNNDICDAISLTVNADECTEGTNVDATTSSPDEVGICWAGGANSHTVWYSFIAPASGNVMVTTDNTTGTLTDTQLAIFSSSDNTCTGILTEENCDEDGGSICIECAAVNLTELTPGQIYFVELDGYSTNTGTFCIDVHDGGDVLTNDNCANAMNIWVGSACNLASQYTYTTYPTTVPPTLASAELGEPTPACWTQGTTLNTVWYKFTAKDISTNIKIEAVSGGTDPHAGIYSGACGSLVPLACQEDKGGTGAASKGVDLSFATTIGEVYYVQYDSDVALGGNRICINSASGSTTPSNDACASAQSLTLNVPTVGNNWLATADGSFSCGSTENSVWYSYTPSITGEFHFTLLSQDGCYNNNGTASIHTSFFQASLQMALFNPSTCSPPPTSTNEIGCVSSENNNDIEIITNLTSGNTYLVNIDGLGGSACEYTIEVSDYSLLPVSLLSFKAFNKGNKNVIEWVTASEVNNDFFTIEKSTDAVNFEEVKIVKGAGNSNNYEYYSSFDYEPLNAVNYYRLKQTDFDGKSYYPSLIVAVNNTNNLDLFNFSVFPNPNNGKEMRVSIIEQKYNNITITIRDIHGRELYVKPIDIEKNTNNSIPISLDNKLSSGLYLISVSNIETAYNKLFEVK